MTRAVAGALVFLACCAQRETPAPPPKPATSTREVKAAPVPPAPPHFWRVSLLRSGGFAGGMQGFAASSDHAKEACTPEVEKAVVEAHPEAWQRSYPESPGITDQFHYSLTLKADDRTFQSAWSTGSAGLPPDLDRLAAALGRCH